MTITLAASRKSPTGFQQQLFQQQKKAAEAAFLGAAIPWQQDLETSVSLGYQSLYTLSIWLLAIMHPCTDRPDLECASP